MKHMETFYNLFICQFLLISLKEQTMIVQKKDSCREKLKIVWAGLGDAHQMLL